MDVPPSIHATADVAHSAAIGANTSIWHQCQIREHAQIGQNCILGKGVYVDTGVAIGDNVKVQNGALLYHGLTVESGVFIGPVAVFTNDKMPRAITPEGVLKSDDDWSVGRTLVQYGASVGAGAVILPGITIGRFALVGAGAVVVGDVPDHGLVAGNPAKLIGYVCRCAHRLVQQSDGAHVCPACHLSYDIEADL